MYNKVVMIGNLTRDIELRYLPSGAAIAKSAIATSYRYKAQDGSQKDEVCFLDFNIFNRSAEVANQYLKKGSKVLLEGRLVFEQWTAPDGTNRSRHSLRVETMKMLDSRNDNNQGGGNSLGYESNQGGSIGYNQQNSQPQNNSYNNNYNSYDSAPNNGGYNQAPKSNNGGMHNNIPEIDIDDDEIPF